VAEALGVESNLPEAEPLAPLPVKPDTSTEPLPAAGLTLVAEPPREASPRPTRRFGRAAIVIVAVLAAVGGGALALALDPFGGDSPRAETPSAAAAWSRLDDEQARLRTELAAAETPQEQTEIAGRLADAYDTAARAAGPGEQARAARAVSDAYAALAAAAAAGEESGYAQASEDIARAEQQLQARR
jgi:hypothetical protein